MVFCATGHRPQKLGGYTPALMARLDRFCFDILEPYAGCICIVGMALGFDQSIAEACIARGIEFIAAVPFEGQERLWPTASQKRYCRILAHASDIQILAPAPGNTGMAARLLQERNVWMVDRSNHVLAMWDKRPGSGTRNCVLYAEGKGIPVDNVWDRWMEYRFADQVQGLKK